MAGGSQLVPNSTRNSLGFRLGLGLVLEIRHRVGARVWLALETSSPWDELTWGLLDWVTS